MTETIIKTIILIPPMLLIMAAVSVLFDFLNRTILKLINRFYSTKIGYYFEKYKLFERIFFGTITLLIIVGTLLMGKEMIAYYRR